MLAPVGFAIALAALVIAPAQALWFQTLTADVSVTTGAVPNGDPSQTPHPTASPRATSTPCHRDWHDHVRFDGDVSVAGNGPFSVAIELTNSGETTARGGLLGLAAVDGWGYVSRVDFGNGQTWLVGGQPGTTLYSVGDIEAGGAARVSMTIEMTDAWRDAPVGGGVDLRIELAGQSCDDHGADDDHVRIGHGDDDGEHDGEDDEAEETSTPSPAPTLGPTNTPSPASTATAPPNPTTSPSSTPTPSPTGTPDDANGERHPG